GGAADVRKLDQDAERRVAEQPEPGALERDEQRHQHRGMERAPGVGCRLRRHGRKLMLAWASRDVRERNALYNHGPSPRTRTPAPTLAVAAYPDRALGARRSQLTFT